MKTAIEASAAACFTVPPTAFCGDGVVDYADGEECDACVYGGDACCSATCLFIPPAVCSTRTPRFSVYVYVYARGRGLFFNTHRRAHCPGNSRCCRDCQLAGSDKVVRVRVRV